MAKVIQLRVITTTGEGLTDEAVSVRSPGADGLLGILYNHAPLVSLVSPGVLSWKTPSGAQKSAHVGAGILEVSKNRVTVLAESLEEAAQGS